jgi:hypothetical protein
MKSRKLSCAIENLSAWHPHLYVEPYEVAFVAVTGQYSVSPGSFEVDCEGIESRWLGKARQLTLDVSWTEQTIDKAERLRTTMPTYSLVELAAIAVALVLVHQVVPLGALNVLDLGGRADYRSSVVRRVLEISGTEDLGQLRRRRREKVAQALANPFGWDAYVVVCAFTAQSLLVRFTGHRWEEPSHGEA